MSPKKSTLKAATQALILGLALSTTGAGAGLLAAPAVAEPATAPGAKSNPAAGDAIIKEKPVSLTLYKRLNPDTVKKDPNGKQDDSASGTPLKDVEYKVTRLDYKVWNNSDLQAARKATIEEAKAHKTGTVFTGTTDKKGMVTWNTTKDPGLTVGAYLVEEVSAANAKTVEGEQEVPEKNVVTAEPFIAFLPMTDLDNNNQWQYDVVAYPKNTNSKITKSLTDGGEVTVQEDQDTSNNLNTNVGEEIKYDITATRPGIDPWNQYYRYYEIYDNIPKGLSFDKANKADKIVVTLVNDKVDPKKTVDVPKSEYEIVVSDTQVRVIFKQDGLLRLTKAGRNYKVNVNYTFKIDGVDNDGAFTAINNGGSKYKVEENPDAPEKPENTPPANPDKPDNPNPGIPTVPTEPENPGVPTVPENPENPTTPDIPQSWVPIKISKENAESKDKKNPEMLGGAEFELYRCSRKDEDSTPVLKGAALSVDGENKWVTSTEDDATKGTVVIKSLRYRALDSEAATYTRAATEGYCLVETKAPDKYELLPAPYFFQLEKTDIALKAPKLEHVKDVPKNNVPGLHLPNTGGMGVGLLIALGGLVLGGGAWLARRNSKSQA